MPQFEDWQVVRELGSGAYGMVYEIQKTDEFGFSTKSALKVIRIPQSEAQVDEMRSKGESDEAVAEYFRDMTAGVLDEVRAMYQLRGRNNIVNYEDHRARQCEDGISWELLIRMELLTPLNKYIRDHNITRKTVIKLGIDICNALERCQKFNIIHRDIKPSNILVNKDGDFKLSDFGIARRVEEDATMAMLSQKGTPSYMAPEIYQGKPYGFSVDIYSLGIVMYQLLNYNRDPFLPTYPDRIRHGDQTRAQSRRLSGERLPKPAQDSGQLAEIVLKACSYDPAKRYSSPRQMREDLESIQYNDADWEQVVGTSVDALTIPGSDRSITAASGSGSSGSASVEQKDEKQSGEQDSNEGVGGLASGGDETVHISSTSEPGDLTENMTEQRDPTVNLNGGSAEEPHQEGESDAEADDASSGPEPPPEAEDASGGGTVATEDVPDPVSDGAGDAPAKRPKAAKIAVILLVVLLAVFGGYRGYYYMTTTSEVPDVSLMTEQEAVAALEAASLVVGEEEWVYSDEVDKGCVVSVSNEGEQVAKRVAKNTSLTLTLSLGSIVTVPNELGAEGEEAVSALEQLGLTVSTDSEYSDEYAEGQVIAQSLEAESDVDEGTEIVLTLSLGSKPFELESYTGQTSEDAQAALEALGLTVEVKKSYSTEVEKGSVISQSPEAGEQVRKGDTVTIKVSKGLEQVVVPDVTGMTTSEATAALEAVGLTLGGTTNVYSNSVSSGYITEQGTAAGTEVDKGSSVSVKVSIGPEPSSNSDNNFSIDEMTRG